MGASARAPSRRGSRSTAPRHLTAASRGPSWPPCSGAHLCARGNSSSSRIVCLPVLRVALRAFSVLRPMGLAASRIARASASPQPGGPPGPPAGFICGFVGRRAGGVRRTNNGRAGRGAARPNSSSAPGATGNHARVQRPQARQRGTGKRDQSDQNRTTVPTLPGPQTAAQENPHVRADPLRPRRNRGTVETRGSNSPTVPTWPDSPPGN